MWVDASNGVAGDMLLAALLDAGASEQAVRAALGRLPVETITLRTTSVRRHGLRALRAEVLAPEAAARRGIEDIRRVITSAGLAAPATDFALSTFQLLARAEARVHGVAEHEVHFHEVGALDAIADVVGCAVALHELSLLRGARRVVGPVAVGSGTALTAHGRLPVPVPAVLELLSAAGAPITSHPSPTELCTPTGAALLVNLATSWGPPPALTGFVVGVGGGTRDPDTHPNAVRVVVGTAGAGADTLTTSMMQIEATIDDMDPRLWPDVISQLRGIGAADAWCVPALTHKGRPGQVLTVLVDPDLVDAACAMVFTQTTTLGLRLSPVSRRRLRRDVVRVLVDGYQVDVKRAYLGDGTVRLQPEYDDAKVAAAGLGLPIAEAIDRARREAAGRADPE
ncbi:nickel pincer cofactor biosynthesis protein LarC [Dactylosporangium sp. CA-092794]|uniref:nickel pincer cofactor biosynthesis protein LarC n=1 Tax=Dactylosporangium sp. CA-092794 TaxID=3239929 RepID=UPI003D8E6B98